MKSPIIKEIRGKGLLNAIEFINKNTYFKELEWKK